MLAGEEAAGAPETGMHLVDAEQRPVAAAQLLRALEIAGLRQVDAFAEDRLDDEDRDVLTCELRLERAQVVERDPRDAGEVRAEAVGERRFAVDGQ